MRRMRRNAQSRKRRLTDSITKSGRKKLPVRVVAYIAFCRYAQDAPPAQSTNSERSFMSTLRQGCLFTELPPPFAGKRKRPRWKRKLIRDAAEFVERYAVMAAPWDYRPGDGDGWHFEISPPAGVDPAAWLKIRRCNTDYTGDQHYWPSKWELAKHLEWMVRTWW